MTSDQARAEAARLKAEHPDRDRLHWLPRENDDGSWSVIKVRKPPGTRVDPLKATTEAKPKPQQPEDPRSNLSRDTGGAYGA